MKGYTTFQIVKALNIPRERLKDWMEKGFVKPSLQQARGKGTKALFSLLDVYALALFKHLIEECHFTRDAASQFSSLWLEYIYNFPYEEGKEIPDRAISDLLSNELIYISNREADVINASDKENQEKTDKRKMMYSPFSFYGKSEDLFNSITSHLKPYVEKKTWEDIHIVNFKKIRETVDAALAS
jgi:hypothetical protein